MFSSKRSDTYGSSSYEGSSASTATVIARGVRVEGEFASQGDVLIEGEVHGHVATSGMLTVGPEARLKADVTAQEAVVAGTVEGNLTVKNRLELKSTAKVVGDIACETAVVEAGAVLNGKTAIGAKSETPSKHEKNSKQAPPPPPSEE